jgi:cyanophycin synthetase
MADLTILRAQAYMGANVIAAEPLAHLSLDYDGALLWPGGEGPGEGDGEESAAAGAALLRLLPGLASHPGPDGRPGGFAALLKQAPDLPLARVIAQIAVELQCSPGTPPQPAGARQDPAGRVHHIFYPYDDPDIAVLAGQAAVRLAVALLPPGRRPAGVLPQGYDPERALAGYRRQAAAAALDQTAQALIDGALRRGIPWFPLDRPQRIVQLGQGRHLRRIRETVTSGTGAIATWLQRDKMTTARLLARLFLPVPEQGLAADAGAAVRIAERIGFPVVVKPRDGKKGLGISLGLDSAEAVHHAYAHARQYSRHVLVETFVPGHDHRVLAVGGRIVAAARRIPAAVTGDGRRSVEALVADANADPRRGEGFSRLMNRIELDAQAEALLQRQGHTRASVPQAGARVYLRATANISTGGTAVDVTDRVHPDNRTMLERAARVSGLDVVGIDFITPDISRSYREAGGAICELNASPGLRPHQVAAQVPGAVQRDVVGPILDLLFPGGGDGRIPVAAITGTNGKTTTTRLVAHILRHAGGDIGAGTIGRVTTTGVYIDDQLVALGDFAGRNGARILLEDPAVEAAVVECARGGLVKGGLGFDRCDVGAVLNVDADHLGLHGIETVADMAVLKGRVVEASRRLAVLNADDPLCAAMADLKGPARVCLFTLGGLAEALRSHVAGGGLAITLEEESGAETIVLHERDRRLAVIAAAAIPATLAGAARHNIQNAMAALGLALGLGLAPTRIAEALATFKGDHESNPGRLNVYDGYPFTVVHDSAHNPHGIRVICETLKALQVKRRRIVVIAGAGNRHSEHIAEVAAIIAKAFDFFICSRSSKPMNAAEVTRDFSHSEVPVRLAEALIAQGVAPENIMVIDRDSEAVDRGLTMAREGDLLALLTGMVEWTWDRVLAFGQQRETTRSDV